MAEQLVPLGEIVATHGLEGWLSLLPFNPEGTALRTARTVFIARERTAIGFALTALKAHNRRVLIKLAGVDSIDAAKQLVGGTLSIEQSSLPALQAGEYYQFQVIGLDVLDIQGNHLGKVTGTIAAGSGSIYIISGSEKEFLLPAEKEFVDRIDFLAGTMTITPPDGLLDL